MYASCLRKGAVLLAMLLAPVIALASARPPAPLSENKGTPAEVSQLLEQVRTDAAEAQKSAARLESFVNAPMFVSWEAHSGELVQAKHSINDLGRVLGQLERLRPEELPWQRKVVDRIQPMAATLAQRTQSAIKYLDHHESYLWNPTYKQEITDMYKQAAGISRTAAASVEYGKALARMKEVAPTALRARS